MLIMRSFRNIETYDLKIEFNEHGISKKIKEASKLRKSI